MANKQIEQIEFFQQEIEKIKAGGSKLAKSVQSSDEEEEKESVVMFSSDEETQQAHHSTSKMKKHLPKTRSPERSAHKDTKKRKIEECDKEATSVKIIKGKFFV